LMRKKINHSMKLLLLLFLFGKPCFGQQPDTIQVDMKRQDSILNSGRIDIVQWSEAEFPGGVQALIAFVKNNMNYAFEEGISGRVYVRFVVEVDGSITEIEVVKHVHPLLDAEAVRLIRQMPKWIPSSGPEGAEKSRVTLPIIFTLD